MGQDYVRHAKMFFNRPDLDLVFPAPGRFVLMPHNAMLDVLCRDYEVTAG
jgi:hypothetical protein